MKRLFMMIISVLFLFGCSGGIDDPISEEKFKLVSGEFELSAIYTDAGGNTAVLLIAGSGPSDADETVGELKPFADISAGLAEYGISSLRVEKRTYSYPDSFDVSAGLDEEYFDDCRAAIQWLRDNGTESIYLLGHSLGGQIAAALAEEDSSIDGIILWNSTARHLADVSYDQLAEADPANASAYKQYCEAAKSLEYDDCVGYYYFGAPDYYWADYNKLDTLASVRAAKKVLIINSLADRQLYESDYQLWKKLEGEENITIEVFETHSHFGYEIDLTDSHQLFTEHDFPSELIDTFADFIV